MSVALCHARRIIPDLLLVLGFGLALATSGCAESKLAGHSVLVTDSPSHPISGLATRLAAVARTPFQQQVAAILGEYGWPANHEKLGALLVGHPPAEQVAALMPFIDIHHPSNWIPAANAAATYRLGELGEPAVAALATALEEAPQTRREAAASALSHMAFSFQDRYHKPGASAIPRLAWLLVNDPSPGVRREAARALACYEHEANGAIPKLIQALDDPSDGVRVMALCALRQSGPDAWPAVPKVIPWLKKGWPQDTAAEVLKNIGPGARQAVPALIDQLDQEDEGFSDISWALKRIGGITAEHLPALIRKIPRAKASAAADALRVLKPSDPRAVEGLIEALNNVEYCNDPAFAKAIGALARPEPRTLEALRLCMRADRPYTRLWAAYAYYLLTRDAAAALAVLLPIAQGGVPGLRESEARAAAVQALAGMGSDAAPAAETLRRLLPAVSLYERHWVAVALFEVTGEYQSAVELLANDLNDRENWAYLDDAVSAIEALGPLAEKAVPPLVGLLSRQGPWDRFTRYTAARALAGLGPSEATRAALPRLREMAETEESPWNRVGAAEALWQIDHETEAALKGLLGVLIDRGNTFPEAMRVLATMGPAAARAVPVLYAIAESDPNPAFRQEATAAIAAIVTPDPNAGKPADAAAIARWWQDLMAAEADVACPAVWRLAEAGRPAADFLRQRMSNSSARGAEARRQARARQVLALQAWLFPEEQGAPTAPKVQTMRMRSG